MPRRSRGSSRVTPSERWGIPPAARSTLLAALDSLTALGDTVGQIAALVGLGVLAEQLGAPLEAESLYRHGLERLGSRPVPDLRWRLHAGLASSLRGQGALPQAAEHLRAAVAALDGVAEGMRLEERRAGFMADKWQVYAALALAEQARGRAGEAFAVSERMRGRQMLALLDRGRIASRSPAGGQEQDLRRRIAELTDELAGATPVSANRGEPPIAQRSLAVVSEALDAAQKAYAALLAELRESDPTYAAMVAVEPVDWRTTARRLRGDAVLLEYLVTDSASSVLVVTPDTVAALDLNVDHRQLASLVDFARGVMDRHDGTVESMWRAPLRRLYRVLIEPVEAAGFLAGKRSLVIVPHADLHFLPFGALLAGDDGDRFLVERFELGLCSLGRRLAPARRASQVGWHWPSVGPGAVPRPAPGNTGRSGEHPRGVRRPRHAAHRSVGHRGSARRRHDRPRRHPPGHRRRAQQAQSAFLARGAGRGWR